MYIVQKKFGKRKKCIVSVLLYIGFDLRNLMMALVCILFVCVKQKKTYTYCKQLFIFKKMIVRNIIRYRPVSCS